MVIFIQMKKSDEDKLHTLKEIENDRKLTIDLHKKEIRVKRIKEKLDFYSPLVGRCLRFDVDEMGPADWLDEITTQNQVNGKYELYADEATKTAFRLYFSGVMRGSGEWNSMRTSIKESIISDFNRLADEYQSYYEKD